MSAPTVHPNDMDPAQVAPAESYQPTDPVWVYRAGIWHPGVVMAASTRSATVSYRPDNAHGTAVDTLPAPYLHPRADNDPVFDNAARSQ